MIGNISLPTFSYLETITAGTGWGFYAVIYGVFQETGVIALPPIFLLIRCWADAVMKARGSDAARMSLASLESRFALMAFVFFTAFVPYFNVQPYLLDTSKSGGKQCAAVQQGKATALPGAETFGQVQIAAPAGASPQAPAWWLAMLKLNAGINYKLIDAVGCFTDWNLIETTVRGARISNPVLRDEYNRFAGDCYAFARNTHKREGSPTEDIENVGYIGAKHWVDNYYSHVGAFPRAPLTRWKGREDGKPKNCRDWWLGDGGENIGLRDLLYDATASAKAIKKQSTQGGSEAIRIALANMDKDKVIQAMLESNPPDIATPAKNPLGGIGATALVLAQKLKAAERAADFLLQAYFIKRLVAYGQPIILALLYLLAPVFLLISGYRFKDLITYTFFMLAIQSLPTIFVLSAYIESSILESLYPGGFKLQDSIEQITLRGIFTYLPIIMGVLLIWILTMIGHSGGAIMEGYAIGGGAGMRESAGVTSGISGGLGSRLSNKSSSKGGKGG